MTGLTPGRQRRHPPSSTANLPPSLVLYPLTFHPIFKERPWGGRRLQELYGKPLPPGVPVGESWEISARPGDASVIANGPLAGKDLQWLMQTHSREVLGDKHSRPGWFPLLVKLLDAREKLSLQVHPPAARAAQLAGEPKTEMWYIADAVPGAELYVGLKRGVTREAFERRITAGTVADCFHRIHVRPGDVMFLPSGRVHAIGAGLVIFEIQQNSDTTYRVFDWNRVGLDDKRRQLHVAESLASIDFEDFEPGLVPRAGRAEQPLQLRSLVNDPLFTVDAFTANARSSWPVPGRLTIVGVVEGHATVTGAGHSIRLVKGQFGLVPAAVVAEVTLEAGATALLAQA